MKVPFHKPFFDEREAEAAAEAVRRGEIVGGGAQMLKVERALEVRFQVAHVLATTSCTHSLELALMTLGIGPGDEVIIPAYTFASTATSIVRQGARIVYCDVRPTDLNMDVEDAARCITPKTKCIIPVHYAGYPCDMGNISALAKDHQLKVVEDAAQGVDSVYQGRALGTWGDFGCYSFHGTKSIGCGEGGALTTHDEDLARRAEMLREKGTDRAQFIRGEIDKYTWRDEGSSFIPSDILMAVLAVQVEKMDEIREKRTALAQRYREGLQDLEKSGRLTLPPNDPQFKPNHHIFYVLMNNGEEQEKLFTVLRNSQIGVSRHYYPLDRSPYGKQFARPEGPLPVAQSVTERMIRLPLYTGMPFEEVDFVLEQIHKNLS